jgi:hypothetical protein
MSSSKTISPPGLNAKLLGTEFERNSDSEIVNRSLVRLVAVYGDPWGSDRSKAKVMAEEWVTALADLPAVIVDGAVTEWLRGHSRWPRPADIRSIADRMLRAPIEAAANRHGIHPRRIEPAESMKGFLYSDSPLRRFPIWKRWLDSQHPTSEHFFFAKAECYEPHEIFGLSEFEADYVRQKFGRELTKHFGRAVGLGIGPYPCRKILWTDEPWIPPTEEEKARVSAAVKEMVDRNRAPASKSRASNINLDGATREFLDLVGAEHAVPESPPPDTAVTQTSKSPTASSDFDDAWHGRN